MLILVAVGRIANLTEQIPLTVEEYYFFVSQKKPLTVIRGFLLCCNHSYRISVTFPNFTLLPSAVLNPSHSRSSVNVASIFQM